MTKDVVKPAVAAVKQLLGEDQDHLREIVREVMQAMLEAEMDETIGAAKSERKEHWLRDDDRGGVEKARRRGNRIIYLEIERGNPEPIKRAP